MRSSTAKLGLADQFRKVIRLTVLGGLPLLPFGPSEMTLVAQSSLVGEPSFLGQLQDAAVEDPPSINEIEAKLSETGVWGSVSPHAVEFLSTAVRTVVARDRLEKVSPKEARLWDKVEDSLEEDTLLFAFLCLHDINRAHAIELLKGDVPETHAAALSLLAGFPLTREDLAIVEHFVDDDQQPRNVRVRALILLALKQPEKTRDDAVNKLLKSVVVAYENQPESPAAPFDSGGLGGHQDATSLVPKAFDLPPSAYPESDFAEQIVTLVLLGAGIDAKFNGSLLLRAQKLCQEKGSLFPYDVIRSRGLNSTDRNLIIERGWARNSEYRYGSHKLLFSQTERREIIQQFNQLDRSLLEDVGLIVPDLSDDLSELEHDVDRAQLIRFFRRCEALLDRQSHVKVSNNILQQVQNDQKDSIEPATLTSIQCALWFNASSNRIQTLVDRVIKNESIHFDHRIQAIAWCAESEKFVCLPEWLLESDLDVCSGNRRLISLINLNQIAKGQPLADPEGILLEDHQLATFMTKSEIHLMLKGQPRSIQPPYETYSGFFGNCSQAGTYWLLEEMLENSDVREGFLRDSLSSVLPIGYPARSGYE